MVFTDIRVQNYRSYVDSSFELGPGVNIVVGPNAIGKTNLLEALMISAGNSSYRSKDDALVRHSATWARIDTHTSTNQTRVTKIRLESSEQLNKSFELDDKSYKRFPPPHRQPVVLFEPNDLLLLSGEPSRRREYFDEIIEKYDSSYRTILNQYRRVVAQRNALLKQGGGTSSQLFAWNLRLCELANKTIEARTKLIDELNKKIKDIYSTIANEKSNIQLVYTSKTDLKNYQTNLLKQLEQTLELDMARGFTGSGPHRDDIVVIFDDQTMVSRASRGEVRTLLLSLKILELELLEGKTDKRPLLLLDDVFSELDGARRRSLTSYLHNYQTLITTTDADIVVQHFTENTTVIPIS